MKVFKKMLLLLLMSLLFSMPTYAAEVASNETETTLPLIYGMDATSRREKLNIREEPNNSSEILATIHLDEHITIIDQIGKWFEVKYDNISGFVLGKHISFTEPEIEEDSNLVRFSIVHFESNEWRDNSFSLICEAISGTTLEPKNEFRWRNYTKPDYVVVNNYDFPIRMELYSYKSVVFFKLYKIE